MIIINYFELELKKSSLDYINIYSSFLQIRIDYTSKNKHFNQITY